MDDAPDIETDEVPNLSFICKQLGIRYKDYGRAVVRAMVDLFYDKAMVNQSYAQVLSKEPNEKKEGSVAMNSMGWYVELENGSKVIINVTEVPKR